MREIKFRVFGYEQNVMYDWKHIVESGALAEYLSLGEEGDNYHSPIMQYTGLKDKNGVEIYLGDIVKREFDIWKTDYDYEGSPNGDECIDEGYFIGVVSQTPSGLYVLNKCRKYDVDGNILKKCSGIKLFAHRCEVIGNIYENGELLNES